jgi:hypothetical protein
MSTINEVNTANDWDEFTVAFIRQTAWLLFLTGDPDMLKALGILSGLTVDDPDDLAFARETVEAAREDFGERLLELPLPSPVDLNRRPDGSPAE